MTIFNSLGSNYNVESAFASLRPFSSKSQERLKLTITREYNAGSVYLTNKCREAISLILKTLDIPKGSGVVITGFTCYVVYEAVEAAGMVPVLVDIEKDELNFSADSFEKALRSSPDIRAVIVQNTFGIPADITSIERIANKHGIKIIEDLPHAAGMFYADGRMAGTVGDAAALSFGMNKIIDSVTGGAAVFRDRTDCKEVFRKVGAWQQLGSYLYPTNTWLIRATHSVGIGKVLLRFLKALRLIPEPTAGYAGNIHTIPNHQAGLALSYMAKLPDEIKHRQEIAGVYRESLPKMVQFNHHQEAIYLRFPIRVENRSKLTQFLKQYGIQLGLPWYDTVIAPQRCMSKVNYTSGQCQHGEFVSNRVINLPTHVNIDKKSAQYIADKVNQWLESQQEK